MTGISTKPQWRRVIVTGANGSGKSHLSQRMHVARPEVPLISYDALRLTENWQKRRLED